MNDFIKSIKISIEQLDTINTTGMAHGLSSAIIENEYSWCWSCTNG